MVPDSGRDVGGARISVDHSTIHRWVVHLSPLRLEPFKVTLMGCADGVRRQAMIWCGKRKPFRRGADIGIFVKNEYPR